ncbi:MAG: energy transducer TonB [Rhodospirillaceae bacterium]|nr:energy transducer TonB [Rhodospirillaceae bacterium]
MLRFFRHRWPWMVSTLVHGAALAAIAVNLLDSRSKAANVPAQIEMALSPQLAAPTMPQPDQAKPVEPQRQEVSEAKPEDLKDQRPEEVKAIDPIPLVEPMPQLAEIQDVIPVETKAVPPPPPKPIVKPPAPVVAKPPPTPAPAAPPVEAPVQAAAPPPSAAPMPPQLAALPPSVGRPGADTEYFSVILAWLEKHKEYPRQAQMRRQQGTAVLHFELDRSGRVLSYRIKSSSGFPELDREVEAMLKRAEPLPPIPADLAQAKLELQVPVQFRLR